ncbi:unnamed protein product [Lepidochelys olivacea]
MRLVLWVALLRLAAGSRQRAGGLEMGLRVMLWMLRASLLLAMAMGGWLCCDTGSRPRKMVEQATERIWDPLRQTFQRAREAISSRSR